MTSDLRKEEYFRTGDWTAQTGIEFPQEIGFSAHGILEAFCSAIDAQKPVCPASANFGKQQTFDSSVAFDLKSLRRFCCGSSQGLQIGALVHDQHRHASVHQDLRCLTPQK